MKKIKENSENSKNLEDIIVVYDRECFFCHNFVTKLELKKQGFNLVFKYFKTLPEDLLFDLKGIDLDQNMVVIFKDKKYIGPEALCLIYKLCKSDNWYTKIVLSFSSTTKKTEFLYPVFRFVRQCLKKLKI